MAHLVRAEFGVGWSGASAAGGWVEDRGLGVGYEQYLFLGPGLSWAVGVVHWLSMGLISAATAFKVVVIGSFLALPLAVAFLARSLGLGRRAAGLAAVLSLCVSSPFGGAGIPGTFDIGLVSHQFGAVPTVLALGGMLHVAVDRRRRWGRLLTAAALAAVLVSHAISAIILAVLLAIMLATLPLTDRVTTGALGRLAATTALAGGLAAFWLVPVAAHRDLHGMLTSWENPPLARRLADILGGQLLFRGSLTVWFLAAGWLFCVVRFKARRRWALALLACPFAYLWVADAFLRWESNHLVSLQLANRGLGYAGLVAVLPLAALLGHLGRRLGWLGDLGAIACAVVLVVMATGPDRHLTRVDDPSPQLRQLAGAGSASGCRWARASPCSAPTGSSSATPVCPCRAGGWPGRPDGHVANMFNVELSPLARRPRLRRRPRVAVGRGRPAGHVGRQPRRHCRRRRGRRGPVPIPPLPRPLFFFFFFFVSASAPGPLARRWPSTNRGGPAGRVRPRAPDNPGRRHPADHPATG